jgi:hypothetical protein
MPNRNGDNPWRWQMTLLSTSIHTKRFAYGLNHGVICPLHGGTTTYVETLLQFLETIHNGTNTREDLVQWFIDTFDAVKSTKTSAAYVTIPKYMGLIQIANNRDLNFLYDTITENILAFDDIVAFLANESEPQSLQAIPEYVMENFNLGKIEKVEDGYIAKDNVI